MGLIPKATLAGRRVKEDCSRGRADMIDREGMDCGKGSQGDNRPRSLAPDGRKPVLETAWASLVEYLMYVPRT